ncbi:MAG: leucine--tRNA ligase [Clostridia bacterium]|nr:leucine--tRNA ligase [Clostridia bacterium]
MEYNFKDIEEKWQKKWDDEETFKALNDSDKEKYYALIEFPYPSGAGLHVGHPRGYTALDVIARKRRMEGYNVLYPIGWDAFGLPAENYAIKNKIHPSQAVEENIKVFKGQLKNLGISFDWSREFSTTDPDYYKWTQWCFLKFLEHDMAYKAKANINWCNSCKVGLSNEDAEGGVCDRCGGPVVKKEKEQWMLKMKSYADKLIDGLDDTNFIERVKTAQVNWIGKSKGAEVSFKVKEVNEELEVFTTRPDTLYGVTFMVLAPEHPMLDKYKDIIKNFSDIENYRIEANKKSEFERVELAKDKTGVKIDGLTAINPINGKEIEVWISDYVMMGYGTGAIMAVPAHDTRDYEFAKKFGIDIVEVISGGDIETEAYTNTAEGTYVNSDILNGKSVKEGKEAILEYIKLNNLGKEKTNYKLQDWVFSRQRYWGEPIPVVHCDKCGHVPVPESQLPVELPNVASYEPTDNGESPLANIREWVETTCPKCGGYAERETDTMPNWAGSSWYYIRYMDPKNSEELASEDAMKYWGKVDWYNGGMEHATRHLLYARFWHRFFYDIGVLPTAEPFNVRTAHGMILGDNGEKMSKSKGNVVNPDDIVRDFGSDTLRTYIMFIGDFEKSVAWSENGVRGAKRFLEKVWKLNDIVNDSEEYTKEFESLIHKTIKKVTDDYEAMKYNTAIAALMGLINEINKVGKMSKADLRVILTLLNPVAPHITEELWEMQGFEGQVSKALWPKYDEAKMIDDVIEIPVQVNGKVRAKIEMSKDASQDEVLASARQAIEDKLEGKSIVKEIYVPGRILNIVVK